MENENQQEDSQEYDLISVIFGFVFVTALWIGYFMFAPVN